MVAQQVPLSFLKVFIPSVLEENILTTDVLRKWNRQSVAPCKISFTLFGGPRPRQHGPAARKVARASRPRSGRSIGAMAAASNEYKKAVGGAVLVDWDACGVWESRPSGRWVEDRGLASPRGPVTWSTDQAHISNDRLEFQAFITTGRREVPTLGLLMTTVTR